MDYGWNGITYVRWLLIGLWYAYARYANARYANARYVNARYANARLWKYVRYGWNARYDVIDKINKFAPEILFVAFGNPKQEIWIHKHLLELKVSGAMAVGGTLRYFAGFSILPPEFLEKAGLEWLWRLITEPTRIVRIFRAVVIFPLKVFIYKLMHNG